MTLRIGIAGISGRMGRLLAEEVAALAALAGGTSRSGAGPAGVVLSPDLAALAEISDLIIDFTHASTVEAHAAVLAAAGKPWVLGTTGFDAAATQAIAAAARQIPVIAAPNYCTGVNVAFAIAERLGATLPADAYDAEILEMHHRQKVDAPSGTALGLGHAVAAGRGVKLKDVMVSGRDGHTGARKDGEIGFATLRGGQIVGSHTLSFTAGSEQISLTHHALDRRVFATGAVRTALWLHGQPPGLYTMRDVLGF
ncbi:4-hydroxy-tetrahydrodipicolinate reductase [Acidocella sp.]|jgi:4-hydroxy-tetrahydrodipicolinate reductase|uniref:4-hydroxy-tetrahydrodipicolinate reductase n=1 Tax=Acidocella sp. TaxID=50710 RepID=UPI002F3FE6C3